MPRNPDPANPRQPDPPASTITPHEDPEVTKLKSDLDVLAGVKAPAAGDDLATELGIDGASSVADLARGFRKPRTAPDKDETVALPRTSTAAKFGPTAYGSTTRGGRGESGFRRTKDECLEDAITALDIGRTDTAMQLLHQAGKSAKECRAFISDYQREQAENEGRRDMPQAMSRDKDPVLSIFEQVTDPLHPTVLQAATIAADFLDEPFQAGSSYVRGDTDIARDLLTSFLTLTAKGYNPLKVLQRLLDEHQSIPRQKVYRTARSIEQTASGLSARGAVTAETRTLMKDIINHARHA